ncbi:dihydroorotase [Luteolibacter pohnpeiensis]|uniref:Dihydroorotase n=1 Tax=Luteolibacter pohnpeiensis TaxID=454153 RepID=A0A934VY31_9BACT|nr:dihydroorotase [Luteolibacter pohnpeiensis]MBK1884468.1 dihydroorotase [Luteolibacter pohnpeiensis]
MTVFITNARIASETSKDLPTAHILIQDGVIKSVGPDQAAPADANVIDAKGRIAMPAMFDAHVHFREPGQEAKETIQSGSEAAINGGITGVVMMPNTSPAIDSGTVVAQVLEIAKKNARIPVYTSGCVTKGRHGKELAGIDGMRSHGVKMLTDDGDSTGDPAILFRAMQYASELGMFFASHCEVPELAGPRALNEGVMSYKLGIKGSPACAEEIIIDRDIRLAHATGAHIHIQHVSSKLGMETIAWWKARGDVKVTAEVSPHHLLFTDEHIGDYDTHYKMNPPLRTKADNEALLQGLIDGTFDLIATDHAPHTPFEKSQDFVAAPNGITGLDTALVSLYHHFIATGNFGWDLLIKRYSAEPRRMMGLDVPTITEGSAADLILFDPEAETTFTADFMKSKSRNTPFLDQTLKGRVDLVILGDEILLQR